MRIREVGSQVDHSEEDVNGGDLLEELSLSEGLTHGLLFSGEVSAARVSHDVEYAVA